ncbi:MAG: CHASE3 domain-containing protein, partial [Leptolyngbya sp.]|nr:CHASE3 domain-containing protein [Candidatus Melainabacteria bacterium]
LGTTRYKSPDMHRILQLLLIITVLIVGMAAVSAFLFYKMKDSEQWIVHTQEILYTQSEVYSNLQDMNLASRGYALTGEAVLLEAYKDGKSKLPGNMTRLKELTQDNAKQQEEIEILNQCASRFEKMTTQLIETRSAALVPGQKKEMDGIRQSLASIASEEKRLLILRSQQSNLNYTLGWCALAFQAILGIGLLGLASRTIKQYTAENRKQLDELESEIEGRKKTEKALGISNSDLQQFAYVASHDLQEPLRTVISFCDLLAKKSRDTLDDDSAKYLEIILENSARMQQLIKDLLLFARLQSQGNPLSPVDMQICLNQAVKALDTAILEADARITYDELPTVIGDATQLSLLFQNLIANAIKFRRDESPQIHIGASQEGEEWRISCTDNGIGMKMEYAERIFVIFQRLHSRSKFDGTGIGLAVCKRIVERHGGNITVNSSPGKGSTFAFTLKG